MRFLKRKNSAIQIPDNDLLGLTDKMIVQNQRYAKSLRLIIQIEHSFPQDLFIQLIRPDGVKLIVLDKGHRFKDLHQFEVDMDAEEYIKTNGIEGDWKLNIIDHGMKDNGKLLEWTLVFGEIEDADNIIIEDQSTIEMSVICAKQKKVDYVELRYKIVHEHVGDLSLTLVAPNGYKKILLHQEGKDQTILEAHWTGEMLKEFSNLPSQGEWRFTIHDALKGDSGVLENWFLNVIAKD